MALCGVHSGRSASGEIVKTATETEIRTRNMRSGARMARLEERVRAKTMQERITDLRARRAELELGGGRERIEKQHASGKLTARERITALVDKATFEEVGIFAHHRASYFGMAEKDLPADGVV